MKRAPFVTQTRYLVGAVQRDRLIAFIQNLPLDADKPLEVVIRERAKARKKTQNDLMFAGPLKDIAEQAWIDGKQFSVEVFHEFLKRELLPEAFDPELCKEGYEKWSVDPGGNRVLTGSTTQLTVKGFSEYLEALYAFGANLGVQFHANPNERQS